jgi:Ca2+-binding EF-hand superfamily protein
MKNSAKFALVAALGLTLAAVTVNAQTDAADASAGPRPGGPPPGAPRLGLVLKDLLEKYDINKDGQLDQTELAALRKDIDDGKIGPPAGGPPGGPAGRRGPGGPGGRPPLPKEILDKYDVNKDGKLDEAERAALHKDIQDGKIQLPGGGPQGQGGPGLGHPPTAKEIMAKFDVDKDGKLDETELTAFLQDMRQHRPPPGGPGGPGPGGPPPGDAPQQ